MKNSSELNNNINNDVESFKREDLNCTNNDKNMNKILTDDELNSKVNNSIDNQVNLSSNEQTNKNLDTNNNNLINEGNVTDDVNNNTNLANNVTEANNLPNKILESFMLPCSSRLNPLVGSYLEKLSPTAFKGFQKRFFKLNLTDNALLYWRDEPTFPDQQPQGSINLSGVVAIHIEDALNFVIKTHGRDYCLRALSPGDKDIWLESICMVVNVVANREALKDASTQYDFSKFLIDNSSGIQTYLSEALKTQRKLKWAKEDRVPLTFSLRGKKMFLNVKSIQSPLSKLWFDCVFSMKYNTTPIKMTGNHLPRSSSFCSCSNSLISDETNNKKRSTSYFHGTYRGQKIKINKNNLRFDSNNYKGIRNVRDIENNNIDPHLKLQISSNSNMLTSPIPECLKSSESNIKNFTRMRSHLDNVLFGTMYVEIGALPTIEQINLHQNSGNSAESTNIHISSTNQTPLSALQKYFALLISSRPIANNEAFFPLPNNFSLKPNENHIYNSSYKLQNNYNKRHSYTNNDLENLPYNMQLDCLYLFSPEYDDSPPQYVVELDNIQLSSKIREVQTGFQFRLQVPLKNILTCITNRKPEVNNNDNNEECNENNHIEYVELNEHEIQENNGDTNLNIELESSNINNNIIQTKYSPIMNIMQPSMLSTGSTNSQNNSNNSSQSSNINLINIPNLSMEKISIRIISIFGPDAEIWREALIASCRARHAVKEQRMRTLLDELRAFDSIPRDLLEENISQLFYKTLCYISNSIYNNPDIKRISPLLGAINDKKDFDYKRIISQIANSFATTPILRILQGLDVFNYTGRDLLQASIRTLSNPRIDILKFIHEKYLIPIFTVIQECYSQRGDLMKEIDVLLILDFLVDLRHSYESCGIFDSKFKYLIIEFSCLYMRKVIEPYYRSIFKWIHNTCYLGKTFRDKEAGTLHISLLSDAFGIFNSLANFFSNLKLYQLSVEFRNILFMIIQQSLLQYQLAIRDAVLYNLCTLTDSNPENQQFFFINRENSKFPNYYSAIEKWFSENPFEKNNRNIIDFSSINISSEVICGLLNGIEYCIYKCDELDLLFERWTPFIIFKFEHEYQKEACIHPNSNKINQSIDIEINLNNDTINSNINSSIDMNNNTNIESSINNIHLNIDTNNSISNINETNNLLNSTQNINQNNNINNSNVSNSTLNNTMNNTINNININGINNSINNDNNITNNSNNSIVSNNIQNNINSNNTINNNTISNTITNNILNNSNTNNTHHQNNSNSQSNSNLNSINNNNGINNNNVINNNNTMNNNSNVPSPSPSQIIISMNNQNSSTSNSCGIINSGNSFNISQNSICSIKEDRLYEIDQYTPRNLRNEARRFILLFHISKVFLTVKTCKEWYKRLQNYFIDALKSKYEYLKSSELSNNDLNDWMKLILSLDMDNLLKEALRPQLRVLKISLKKSLFSAVSKLLLEYIVRIYVESLLLFTYYYSTIDNNNDCESNDSNLIAAKLLEDWDIFGHFFQDCISEEVIRECLIILADLHDILTSQRLTLYEKCLEFQDKYRIFDFSLFLKAISILRFEAKDVNLTLDNSNSTISNVNQTLEFDGIQEGETINMNYENNNINNESISNIENILHSNKFSSITWIKDTHYSFTKQMNVLKSIGNFIIQTNSFDNNDSSLNLNNQSIDKMKRIINLNLDDLTLYSLVDNSNTNMNNSLGSSTTNIGNLSNVNEGINLSNSNLSGTINTSNSNININSGSSNSGLMESNNNQLNSTGCTISSSSSSSSNIKKSFSLEFLSQINEDTIERGIMISFLIGKMSIYSPISTLPLISLNNNINALQNNAGINSILNPLLERDEKWWESIYNFYSQVYIPKYPFAVAPNIEPNSLKNDINEEIVEDMATIVKYKQDTHLSRILTHTVYGKFIADSCCYLQPSITESLSMSYLIDSELYLNNQNNLYINNPLLGVNPRLCYGPLQYKYSTNNSCDSGEKWYSGFMFIEDLTIFIHDSIYRFKLHDIISIRPTTDGRTTSICIDPQDLTRTGFILFWGDRESDTSMKSTNNLSPIQTSNQNSTSGNLLTQQNQTHFSVINNLSNNNINLNSSDSQQSYYMDVKNCSLHVKAPNPQLAALWVSEIDSLIQRSKSNWGTNYVETFEKKRLCQYLNSNLCFNDCNKK